MNGQTDTAHGQTVGLFVALGLGLLGFLLASQFFTQQHAILVACIVFLVTLWTNEALPLGVVSLLPLLLFPASGLIDMKTVAVNYSNPIIFLFLGGFLLAIATQKTGLHKILAHKILNIFPATPQGIIYSLLFASSLLSAFLSNTTTALLLISIALFLTNDDRLKIRLVLAVAYGASVGGIITPIGTPPNLILMGFLDGQGLQAMGFMQWVFLTFPLAVLMLIAVGFVLSRGVADCTAIDLDHHDEMTLPQKKLAWVLVALVALLLINSPIRPLWDGLGLNEKGILLAFGLAMFFPGLNFLEWPDSKKIPWEVIFLFGAGFTIASAFLKTGFASEIANLLTGFSGLPLVFLILLVASFVTFSTEITSNTALTSMILPVIYTMAVSSGLNEQLLLMVATICASYAFMLPIATPPNAIAMSSGVVRIRDMVPIGFVLNLIGISLITLYARLFWSHWL